MNIKASLPNCKLMRIIDRLGANARAEQAYCLGIMIEGAVWSDEKVSQANPMSSSAWRRTVQKQILGFLLSLTPHGQLL